MLQVYCENCVSQYMERACKNAKHIVSKLECEHSIKLISVVHSSYQVKTKNVAIPDTLQIKLQGSLQEAGTSLGAGSLMESFTQWRGFLLDLKAEWEGALQDLRSQNIVVSNKNR